MALPSSDVVTSSPSEIPLSQVISDELSAVRKNRAGLMTEQGNSRIHMGILSLCIGINAIYSLLRHDYLYLFIAASFYLNMYYFITLLIPQNFNKNAGLPKADISRFRSWLKEIGLTSGTARFTKLFINSLFINSRTLSLGISLIFTIDILYAIRAYTTLELPIRTTIIVISQCVIIIVFYLLVWKVEPFSMKYVKSVEQVKRRLIQENLPPRIITVLFLIGFLIALVLFLTTIILLPGLTLQAFLDESQLTKLGNLVALLALLAISQYFIIRSIHGNTSRTMADRLFDYKENVLLDLLNTVGAGNTNPENRAETTTRLLETKIYTIKRNTLNGFFPVFVVDLDFSVILDSTTRTAIRGYIGDTKKA
ncbi:MAG TPA: hypothetical protein VN227_01265 [Methanoregula sp.]|nr:hypothetical protein [Methanoregula sp.]